MTRNTPPSQGQSWRCTATSNGSSNFGSTSDMSGSSTIVQKVWSYAHVLKDDGLAFMDYTEQITYLLFLKIAWERRAAGANEIPSRYTWGALKNIDDHSKRLERYHQGLRKL